MGFLKCRMIAFKIIFTLIQELNQGYTDEENFGILGSEKFEILRTENKVDFKGKDPELTENCIAR